MKNYTRNIQYYETDAMGIVHNSNYLRFFEEARCYLLEQCGFPYHAVEENGVMLPVLSSYCEYKSPLRFGDKMQVQAAVSEYTGLRLTVSYRILNPDSGQLCAVGETKHCFVDAKNFRPIRLKKVSPQIDEVFDSLLKSADFEVSSIKTRAFCSK